MSITLHALDGRTGEPYEVSIEDDQLDLTDHDCEIIEKERERIIREIKKHQKDCEALGIIPTADWILEMLEE